MFFSDDILIILGVVSFIATIIFLRLILLGKGKIGEINVANRLKKLPKEDYWIINDLMLKFGNWTTQIDHVVVSRYGVFVIETKNYTGWIFASADAKVWTQTIYKEKNTFQNPLHQNYRHICAISDNLNVPKEAMTGIVAFTGDCEFKTEMPENVVFS